MDEKIAHLGFIQAVITRMGTNSFLLKGWSVTLVAAMFALAPREADKHFLLLAYFPIIVFWVLDGFFLHQEKLFRKLYEEVANGVVSSKVFTMDTSVVCGEVPNELCTMFSKTIWPFHGTIVAIVILAMFVFKN